MTGLLKQEKVILGREEGSQTHDCGQVVRPVGEPQEDCRVASCETGDRHPAISRVFRQMQRLRAVLEQGGVSEPGVEAAAVELGQVDEERHQCPPLLNGQPRDPPGLFVVRQLFDLEEDRLRGRKDGGASRRQDLRPRGRFGGGIPGWP
jgi:hypothetical protein